MYPDSTVHGALSFTREFALSSIQQARMPESRTSEMTHIKTISIDQLKLGMFIVGMDQPWYRTPFLLHKRLIRHAKDIDLLRQHGIREVKIDSSRGLDVEPVPTENLNPASHRHEAAAPPEPILDVPQIPRTNPVNPPPTLRRM